MSNESDRFELAFPRNTTFGSGSTRRRIELINESSCTRAHLSDPFHEMECQVIHDGQHVTDLTGIMHRYPTTLCPGATSIVTSLVGASIHRPIEQHYAPGVLTRNCTHLFDLACLAVVHAARPGSKRVYDAIVPDELNEPVTAMAYRDGLRIHEWTVRRGVVTSPDAVANLPLLGGFLAKARSLFSGDDLEAALVLARAYLISLGRPYDTEAWAGYPISQNTPLRDRCYAYASSHGDAGRFRAGHVRDITGDE